MTPRGLNAAPALLRFLASVDQSGGEQACWPWTGLLNDHGYGRFFVDSGEVRAHRYAYELLVGPIAEGKDLDHECHNRDEACELADLCPHRACCNPVHLREVTNRENLRSGKGFVGRNARAVHCPAGHVYAEHGGRKADGSRYCRECNNARLRRLYAARRALGLTSQGQKRRRPPDRRVMPPGGCFHHDPHPVRRGGPLLCQTCGQLEHPRLCYDLADGTLACCCGLEDGLLREAERVGEALAEQEAQP